MITGINHIATLTSDMDLTVGFYSTVFDATVVHEVEPVDDHPWMKIVDLGGGLVPQRVPGDRRRHRGGADRIGGRGAIDHFGIGVDSLASIQALQPRLADRRRARGRRTIQQLGDEWSLFVRDPDGMDLEICAPVAT